MALPSSSLALMRPMAETLMVVRLLESQAGFFIMTAVNAGHWSLFYAN
jgi:hypothetical protein